MRTALLIAAAAFVAMLGLRFATTSSSHSRAPSLRSSPFDPKEVAGLWSRWPDAKSDGDGVRFYFFHENGIGLYRYGQIGLNTTNSFDWAVDGDELVLTFRKTGEVKRSKFVVDGKQLTLLDDPKEPLDKP